MNIKEVTYGKMIFPDPLSGILSPSGQLTRIEDSTFLDRVRARAEGYQMLKGRSVEIDGEEFTTEPKPVMVCLYGKRVHKSEISNPDLIAEMDKLSLEQVIQTKGGYWLDENSIGLPLMLYDYEGE